MWGFTLPEKSQDGRSQWDECVRNRILFQCAGHDRSADWRRGVAGAHGATFAQDRTRAIFFSCTVHVNVYMFIYTIQ